MNNLELKKKREREEKSQFCRDNAFYSLAVDIVKTVSINKKTGEIFSLKIPYKGIVF